MYHMTMINRVLQQSLIEALDIFPVVLLTGARQVGKSTMAMNFDRAYVTLDNISRYDSAKHDPRRFVQELARPVVIDEIQKAPELLAAIKEDVDRDRVNGAFLLTGSANLLGYQKIADTLAGRMGILELWPLACCEITGNADYNPVDLLFTEKPIVKESIKGEELLEGVLQGGYPEMQKIHSARGRNLWFSSYVSTYIERDVRDIGELRQIDRFIHLVNILAPRSATLLNKAELSRTAGIEQKTLANYLGLLERVYQIGQLRPYSANIGKRFTRAPKVYFSDSGVLCHLLGINSVAELKQSRYYGAVIETYVYSELLKGIRYADRPMSLWHYRTTDRREIDFIIQRGDELVALEVKAAHTVTRKDFTHIEDLRRSMPGLKHGIVLYQGEEVIPFGDNYAIPLGTFCK
jgi:predicted AAA+ superfamily ATPase